MVTFIPLNTSTAIYKRQEESNVTTLETVSTLNLLTSENAVGMSYSCVSSVKNWRKSSVTRQTTEKRAHVHNKTDWNTGVKFRARNLKNTFTRTI
jgi:hypothetical protein